MPACMPPAASGSDETLSGLLEKRAQDEDADGEGGRWSKRFFQLRPGALALEYFGKNDRERRIPRGVVALREVEEAGLNDDKKSLFLQLKDGKAMDIGFRILGGKATREAVRWLATLKQRIANASAAGAPQRERTRMSLVPAAGEL